MKYILEQLVTLAAHEGRHLYTVGGAVRDALFLGQRSLFSLDKDIDVVVEGDARILARKLHEKVGGYLKEFSSFFTAKLVFENGEVDFASTRTEIYRVPGALPEVSLGKFEEDLQRRDFTINTLALSFDRAFHQDWGKEDVLDLYGGLQDLDNRIIRILHDKSFIDDPTRVFRAFRYRARIQGQFEKMTENLLLEAVNNGAFTTISLRRIFNELLKIWQEREAFYCFKALFESGILEKIPLPIRWSSFLSFIADSSRFEAGKKEALVRVLLLSCNDPAHVKWHDVTGMKKREILPLLEFSIE